MSVDCVYEILNHCEDAKSVFAWMEAVDNAYVPGLGRIPSLDYIPNNICEKFAGRLTIFSRMHDNVIGIYKKYIRMIKWSVGPLSRRYAGMSSEFPYTFKEYLPSYEYIYGPVYDGMSPKFAHKFFCHLPERARSQLMKWPLVPTYPMTDDNISYYEKYSYLIDWKGAYKKHYYTMSPKFAHTFTEILPKYAQPWDPSRFVPIRPMTDANASYYNEYSHRIDWQTAYRDHKRSMTPKFAHVCGEHLLKYVRAYSVNKLLPERTMIDINASYYKKYSHLIDWDRAIKKHRSMSPKFATVCAEYIDWQNPVCQYIYFSYELLRVIKDKICWTDILEHHKLSNAVLIEFVDYIDWNSSSGQNRAYTASTKLLKLIVHRFSRIVLYEIVRSDRWYDNESKRDRYYQLPITLSRLLTATIDFPDVRPKIFYYANKYHGSLRISFVKHWNEKYRKHDIRNVTV